jgi:hypothetical protein
LDAFRADCSFEGVGLTLLRLKGGGLSGMLVRLKRQQANVGIFDECFYGFCNDFKKYYIHLFVFSRQMPLGSGYLPRPTF